MPSAETADRIHEAVAKLRDMGCEVQEISLPSTDYAMAAYYIICTAEASLSAVMGHKWETSAIASA